VAIVNRYWKCQVLGWSLLGLVAVLIPTLFGGLRWAVVGRALTGVLLGIVLTHGLRRHMRRRGWLRLPLGKLAPRLVGASVSIAALMVAGVSPFLRLIIDRPDRSGPMSAIFASHVAIVLGWSLIYIGYHYLEGVRAAEAEKWRLTLSMREAELRALRSQLNPHFLFNTLNNLRGLVAEDPARSQEAIGGLSALLRYALRPSRTGMTTLDRELEATEAYLQLEALRFETRLAYAIETDERAREHPVPTMLLQTLVENAIKHGISRLPEGGAVRVEARKSSDGLHLRVTNTGRLERKRDGRGIGLANSLERLRLLFGDRVRLELEQAGPDEVRCDVFIPAPLLPTPIVEPAPMESIAP